MIRSPSESEKTPKSNNWLVKLIGTIIGTGGLTTLIIYLFSISFPSDPCQDYLDDIRSRIQTDYTSADTNFFYTTRHSEKVSVSNQESANISTDEFFNNIKLPSFYKAYEELKRKMIVPINDSLLMAYLIKSNKNKDLVTPKNVSGNLITLRENINYKRTGICEFDYKVELLTPKKIEHLLPRELYLSISKVLNECDEFQKVKSKPLETSINLFSIYHCLDKNEQFKKEFMKQVKKHETFFQIIDSGFNWLMKDNNMHFKSGAYKISGIYAIVLDKLLQEYAKYIRVNPGKYHITCIGYADSDSIRGDGISYHSEGYYSANLKTIQFANGNSLNGEPIPSMIKGIENGNTKLSYARAFSGIKYIEENFDNQIRNDKRLGVKFYYKGKGIDSSAESNDYKRRIEIKISKEQ